MKGKADTSKKDEGRLRELKRSPSVFFLFFSEFSQKYQAQHPGNESHLAVSKAAAEKWRSMSMQERQPYVDQAGQMKPKFDKKVVSESDGGSAGKRKKAAASGEPKRSPSAFFLVFSEFRKEYQAKHPGNESHLAVSKAAAEKWRSMSTQERQPYVDQAGQMKPKFDKKVVSESDGS